MDNLFFKFYIVHAAAAAAKSLQSCLTLCDPICGSPLGSSVPGILQARILEWVAISCSNAWTWKVKVKSLSRVQRPHGLEPIRLLHPWDFPGKSTGVGCHCLLLHCWYFVLNLDHFPFYNISLPNTAICLKVFYCYTFALTKKKKKKYINRK